MFFFFFNDTATTEIYTLSLHDALPIYLVLLHGRHQIVDGGRGEREIGAEGGGARIPGGGEQRQVVGESRGGVATQCPAQGMFAAAASDDQYSHLFLNASVNAWAARLAESTTSFTTALASFI